MMPEAIVEEVRAPEWKPCPQCAGKSEDACKTCLGLRIQLSKNWIEEPGFAIFGVAADADCALENLIMTESLGADGYVWLPDGHKEYDTVSRAFALAMLRHGGAQVLDEKKGLIQTTDRKTGVVQTCRARVAFFLVAPKRQTSAT